MKVGLRSAFESNQSLENREMFVELVTGRKRPVGLQPPFLTSARAPWKGIRLEHHQLVPFEAHELCPLNNIVFLQLESPITLDWKENGRFESTRILPGQISVVPAHTSFSARTLDSGQFLTVSIEPKFMACVTCQFGDPDQGALIPARGITDHLVQAICMALKTELENGCRGGRFYGESMATALAVHLAQKYSARAPRLRENSGGLAKYQLRRVTEHIHDHLAEEVSLGSLADLVGMSPFHFARMFKQSTGLAPHQYLIKCRVERAKVLLLHSETRIADVAAQLGFCDQSHLGIHFKRIYGVSPRKFLREMITHKKDNSAATAGSVPV